MSAGRRQSKVRCSGWVFVETVDTADATHADVDSVLSDPAYSPLKRVLVVVAKPSTESTETVAKARVRANGSFELRLPANAFQSPELALELRLAGRPVGLAFDVHVRPADVDREVALVIAKPHSPDPLIFAKQFIVGFVRTADGRPVSHRPLGSTFATGRKVYAVPQVPTIGAGFSSLSSTVTDGEVGIFGQFKLKLPTTFTSGSRTLVVSSVGLDVRWEPSSGTEGIPLGTVPPAPLRYPVELMNVTVSLPEVDDSAAVALSADPRFLLQRPEYALLRDVHVGNLDSYLPTTLVEGGGEVLDLAALATWTRSDLRVLAGTAGLPFPMVSAYVAAVRLDAMITEGAGTDPTDAEVSEDFRGQRKELLYGLIRGAGHANLSKHLGGSQEVIGQRIVGAVEGGFVRATLATRMPETLGRHLLRLRGLVNTGGAAHATTGGRFARLVDALAYAMTIEDLDAAPEDIVVTSLAEHGTFLSDAFKSDLEDAKEVATDVDIWPKVRVALEGDTALGDAMTAALLTNEEYADSGELLDALVLRAKRAVLLFGVTAGSVSAFKLLWDQEDPEATEDPVTGGVWPVHVSLTSIRSTISGLAVDEIPAELIPAGVTAADDKRNLYAIEIRTLLELALPTAIFALDAAGLGGTSLYALRENSVVAARLTKIAMEGKFLDKVSTSELTAEITLPEDQSRLRALQAMYRFGSPVQKYALVRALDTVFDAAHADGHYVGAPGLTAARMGSSAFHNALRPSLETELTREASFGPDRGGLPIAVFARILDAYVARLIRRASHAQQAATHALRMVVDASDSAAAKHAFGHSSVPLGFGDWCSCDWCSSVHGPSAYLFDLLHFLKDSTVVYKHDADPPVLLDWLTHFRRDVSSPTAPAIPRRADILKLEISCASATTEVPYIDLGNERLEYMILGVQYLHDLAVGEPDAEPPADTPATTVGTAAERRVEPQYVNHHVDPLIAEAVYPAPLPVDLPAIEFGAWLARENLNWADLMHDWGPWQAGDGSVVPPSSEDIERAELGIPLEEQKFVNGTESRLPVKEWYGLSAAPDAPVALHPEQVPWRTALRRVKTFMERTGLTQEEVRALLAHPVTNPQMLIGINLEAVDDSHPVTGCDIDELVLSTTSYVDVRVEATSASTAVVSVLGRFFRYQSSTTVGTVTTIHPGGFFETGDDANTAHVHSPLTGLTDGAVWYVVLRGPTETTNTAVVDSLSGVSPFEVVATLTFSIDSGTLSCAIDDIPSERWYDLAMRCARMARRTGWSVRDLVRVGGGSTTTGGLALVSRVARTFNAGWDAVPGVFLDTYGSFDGTSFLSDSIYDERFQSPLRHAPVDPALALGPDRVTLVGDLSPTPPKLVDHIPAILAGLGWTKRAWDDLVERHIGPHAPEQFASIFTTGDDGVVDLSSLDLTFWRVAALDYWGNLASAMGVPIATMLDWATLCTPMSTALNVWAEDHPEPRVDHESVIWSELRTLANSDLDVSLLSYVARHSPAFVPQWDLTDDAVTAFAEAVRAEIRTVVAPMVLELAKYGTAAPTAPPAELMALLAAGSNLNTAADVLAMGGYAVLAPMFVGSPQRWVRASDRADVDSLLAALFVGGTWTPDVTLALLDKILVAGSWKTTSSTWDGGDGGFAAILFRAVAFGNTTEEAWVGALNQVGDASVGQRFERFMAFVRQWWEWKFVPLADRVVFVPELRDLLALTPTQEIAGVDFSGAGDAVVVAMTDTFVARMYTVLGPMFAGGASEPVESGERLLVDGLLAALLSPYTTSRTPGAWAAGDESRDAAVSALTSIVDAAGWDVASLGGTPELERTIDELEDAAETFSQTRRFINFINIVGVWWQFQTLDRDGQHCLASLLALGGRNRHAHIHEDDVRSEFTSVVAPMLHGHMVTSLDPSDFDGARSLLRALFTPWSATSSWSVGPESPRSRVAAFVETILTRASVDGWHPDAIDWGGAGVDLDAWLDAMDDQVTQAGGEGARLMWFLDLARLWWGVRAPTSAMDHLALPDKAFDGPLVDGVRMFLEQSLLADPATTPVDLGVAAADIVRMATRPQVATAGKVVWSEGGGNPAVTAWLDRAAAYRLQDERVARVLKATESEGDKDMLHRNGVPMMQTLLPYFLGEGFHPARKPMGVARAVPRGDADDSFTLLEFLASEASALARVDALVAAIARTNAANLIFSRLQTFFGLGRAETLAILMNVPGNLFDYGPIADTQFTALMDFFAEPFVRFRSLLGGLLPVFDRPVDVLGAERWARVDMTRLHKVNLLLGKVGIPAEMLFWNFYRHKEVESRTIALSGATLMPSLATAAPDGAGGVMRLLQLWRLEDELYTAKAEDAPAAWEIVDAMMGVDASIPWWQLAARRFGLSGGDTPTPTGEASELFGVTGLNIVTLTPLHLNVESAVELLKRVDRLVRTARRLSVPFATLKVARDAVAVSDKVAPIRDAVAAVHGSASWPDVATPIFDKIRMSRRDAYVAWLVGKDVGGWTNESDIYADLLFDPLMNPPVTTSRIVFATSAVQLFVQRLKLGIERRNPAGVALSMPSALDEQWTWMSMYRVWEAARKVFLYPENWTDPELLIGATPEYEALKRKLQKPRLDKELIEDTIQDYVSTLHEVSNLQIASHVRATLEGEERVYVLAKTRTASPTFYFRWRTEMGVWSPWERTALTIGDATATLFHDGRSLFVAWTTLESGASDTNGTLPSGYILRAMVARRGPTGFEAPQALRDVSPDLTLFRGSGDHTHQFMLLPVPPGTTMWREHVLLFSTNPQQVTSLSPPTYEEDIPGPVVVVFEGRVTMDGKSPLPEMNMVGVIVPGGCAGEWTLSLPTRQSSKVVYPVHADAVPDDVARMASVDLVAQSLIDGNDLVAPGPDAHPRARLESADGAFPVPKMVDFFLSTRWAGPQMQTVFGPGQNLPGLEIPQLDALGFGWIVEPQHYPKKERDFRVTLDANSRLGAVGPWTESPAILAAADGSVLDHLGALGRTHFYEEFGRVFVGDVATAFMKTQEASPHAHDAPVFAKPKIDRSI